MSFSFEYADIQSQHCRYTESSRKRALDNEDNHRVTPAMREAGFHHEQWKKMFSSVTDNIPHELIQSVAADLRAYLQHLQDTIGRFMQDRREAVSFTKQNLGSPS